MKTTDLGIIGGTVVALGLCGALAAWLTMRPAPIATEPGWPTGPGTCGPYERIFGTFGILCDHEHELALLVSDDGQILPLAWKVPVPASPPRAKPPEPTK